MNGNKVHLTGKKKVFALVGMSGCGKTFLSQSFANKGFFHYSVDWEIANILRPQILQSVLEKIKNQSPFFKDLHEKFAIKTELSLTFDDLSAITSFVIPLNDKNKVKYKDLITNQNLYKEAELQATEKFFSTSQNAMKFYQMQGAICDSTGSIFEIMEKNHEMIEKFKENGHVVYIKTTKKHQQTLIERSKNAIKPILYNQGFLNKNLREYYDVNNINDNFEIDGEFFPWVFPNLLEYRQKCYEKLVLQTNGITIDAENINEIQEIIAK